ncbi:MAG: IS200/IS605 family element transposase accessory protein TnpB [Candidatus Diapherotrites archaeon]|nr:IS200/IS605 family element transposase accessory protein TnpB [Candidatus Diapherotrites archaeon]
MMAYKFRLYPSKQQEQALFRTFDLCRFTYNKLLEKMNKSEKINKKEIQHSLVEFKKEFSGLDDVYSKTLQYECHKLFGNLRALVQLKRKGIKVGKLRFKGREWFKTINYNQSGYELEQTGKRYGKLKLSKIGKINIRCHRITSGAIKQITIKKTAGKWYAILITDEIYKKQKGEGQIGLDFGIMNFIADSNGNKIKSPLFLKKSLKKIKKVHQDLSRKKKGSYNRKRAKQKLGKLYEKVENQRNDFMHKLSTKIVSKNKLICIEGLNIKEMISKKKNRFWNMRNFLDCSWAKFASMLKHKAESAGAEVIEVNPKNTSRMCSSCGAMQDIPLSQRTYSCDCGLEIERDVNSAKNILALGWGFVENETASSSMKQEAITSSII